MSEKEKTINIEFNLGNGKIVQECDTNDKQPEKNHYKKIQEAKEGQDLIQELVKVINNIGNIGEFTKALKQYIAKYALLKEKHPSSNFKIRDIKFDYNNEEYTLSKIIAVSFNGNNTLINLYNGIIDQFDRVCEDLDKVFNITHTLDSFENFMNSLSLKTISPLTIELCSHIIESKISSVADNIKTRNGTKEVIERLNNCKNKFTGLQNGTKIVKKDLKNGLSDGEKDLAFEQHNGTFKKDNNYLLLVKDEYNHNYLHYAWRHFEGVSTISDLNNIKARLSEYAGEKTTNITKACKEIDVYGLTPLCHVLIDAFDSGINNKTTSTELSYILKYFEELGVSTQLNQKDLQAIYDYFQITNGAQEGKSKYDDFINTMNNYIQKVSGKIASVKQDKKYKPQIKYKAKTNKEQKQSNEVSVETFLSDNGGYKDKVGNFVDILFKEVYTSSRGEFNEYFIGKKTGYKDFESFKKTYNVIYDGNQVMKYIDNIKQDKKLKYISDNSTHDNSNRNNYCISLFIKALEKEYIENDNPDIMFKFLSDFCKEDMDIKMDNSNYIQIIKYFLNNPTKITDDVKQNIKSLTRYMIENREIQNFSFIKDIIDNRRISDENKQALIQDIVLTAIDNGLSFSGGNKIVNPQQLVQELRNCGFSSSNTTQQDTSIFTIVKNLILSGNVKENENFSQYSGLTEEEKTQLQQILAKTLAVTKIIKEGKEDCSKLKDAVVKFVSDNIGLTIKDIEKIRVSYKSISKFCEDNASRNKKFAYYSWFLNKLVVNNCIAKNTTDNSIGRSGSQEQLIPTAQQIIIPEKQVILDTYKEFENYKTNSIKKVDKRDNYYKTFRDSFMDTQEQNQTSQKRSIVNYYDTTEGKSGTYNENELDKYCPNYHTTTIDGAITDPIDDNVSKINDKLDKVYLHQQATLNQEKSDKFKKFCTVFNLIRANTLLFDAIKGNNKQNSTQKQHGGYNKL